MEKNAGRCWSFVDHVGTNKSIRYTLVENSSSRKLSLYSIDNDCRRLTLGPTPLRLLRLLLDKARIGGAERVATDAEISGCWVDVGDPLPGTIYQTFSAIRRIFGDSAEEQRLIQRGVLEKIAGSWISELVHVVFETQEAFLTELKRMGLSLPELKTQRRKTRARRPPGSFVNAANSPDRTPPAPARIYIHREAALVPLRALVLGAKGDGLALVGLAGMPGIGKTVLVQFLCEDKAIKNAFPDGIFWFTFGREGVASSREGMEHISHYLGDAGEFTLSYREAIRNKSILIVLDDIWSAGDVKDFNAMSPGSVLLFTTRNKNIAAGLGARSIEAPLLDGSEAESTLCRWAGLLHSQLPDVGKEIAAQCQGHALALAMLGAALNGKPHHHWSAVLSRLINSDISDIEMEEFGYYRYRSLSEAFKISLDSLPGDVAVRRYLDLAVLLRGMQASTGLLQTIWSATARDAIYLADLLVARSLAQRHTGDNIKLHDLLLDFVRRQHPDLDQGALSLIHDATRLSFQLIKNDPLQYAPQLIGRLLGHSSKPKITSFIERLASSQTNTWLRPLAPSLLQAGTPLRMILSGHSGGVTAVSIVVDGHLAISGSQDETLLLWDLDSGLPINRLKGHMDVVTDVVATTGGSLAVSASYDKTLILWDLDSGLALKRLVGHQGPVSAVAIAANDCLALSGSHDNTLIAWDLRSGSALKILKGHRHQITAVAVTADGRRAVSGSQGRTLIVWDLDRGSLIHKLIGHTADVTAVAMTPSGGRAVSGSSDGTLLVWDLSTGKLLHRLRCQGTPIDSLVLSNDGKRAIFGSDRSLIVWDLDSGVEMKRFSGHADSIIGVALSKDGNQAITASRDRSLSVWALDFPNTASTADSHTDGVTSITRLTLGRYIASASMDSTVKVWDLCSRSVVKTLTDHSDVVTALSASVDGSFLMSASHDRTLRMWDVAQDKSYIVLDELSAGITAMSWSLLGNRLAAVVLDSTVMVWNLPSGELIKTLENPDYCYRRVALTGEGSRLIVAYDQGVFSLSLGKQYAHTDLAGHVRGRIDYGLTVDGDCVLFAAERSTLKLWDLKSDQLVRSFVGHSDVITDVALSSNTDSAISTGQDRMLLVWDLNTGRQLARFVFDYIPTACAFSDNHSIVVGDAAGNVHFLSLVKY